MITVMRRINTTATNKETSALELTDELKSSDRFGKDDRRARTTAVANWTRANNDSEEITRIELDVDYMQQIHRWGDRETARGTN